MVTVMVMGASNDPSNSTSNNGGSECGVYECRQQLSKQSKEAAIAGKIAVEVN